VLQSKLRPETNLDAVVPRQRLMELLDDASSAPLVLVSAPAGSGKTAMVAGWVAASAGRSAWLSLDETDRDAVQMWTGVFAAVETLAPGVSAGALELLRRPGRTVDAVGALLDAVEPHASEPAHLVIDDIHLVDDDPAALSSLALFVQHLPSWLHVVLISRGTPALPLGRLRGRGQLAEIRFSELRFSQAEAEAMLSGLAPALAAGDIQAAARRAGGWAASIQLTALAARANRAQPDLAEPSGDESTLVEDYVWQEVLSAESDELIDVLLCTSVVERFNIALAVELTGRTDVGDLLARAEKHGLFVSRLGPSGYFRVHALVREVLRNELARRPGKQLADLYERAARWLEQDDQIPVALECYVECGQTREALRLLAAHSAALYDRGLESVILRTIDAIPTSVATADFDSMLEYAWCNVLVSRNRFLEYVSSLTRWAEAEDVDPVRRARLSMLRSMAATVEGDWSRGRSLADEALAEVGEMWWRDPLVQFAHNMIGRDIALSQRWDDTSHEVRAALRSLSVAPDRQLAFEGTRALGEALAGHPVDALRVAAGVRRAADVNNMTILRIELTIAEGIAHRELGDRTEAFIRLQECVDQPVELVTYARLLARLELASSYLDEGDVASAQGSLDRAIATAPEESPRADAQQLIAETGVRVALAASGAQAARQWWARLDDPYWTSICAARILLAEDRPAEAARALEGAVPRSVRHDVILGLLRARTAANQEDAQKHVVAAVEVAVAHGMLQTVASEGLEVARLVEAAAWCVPAEWVDQLRRAAVPGSAVSNRADGLIEDLTDRELEVLRMLPSRLTNREIADELFISVNTLKFHLKVLYRKLDCGSRAEAAEVARALTRLPKPSGTTTRTR